MQQQLPQEAVIADSTGGGKFQVRIKTGDHDFLMDEPVGYGGLSTGPNPFDLLEAALAGCTLMTLRLYAQSKGWPVDGTRVHVAHLKGTAGERDRFVRKVEFDSGLTDGQCHRLREIAERCPVHRLLDRGADVSVEAVDEALPSAVANGLHATEMEDACGDVGQPF